MTRQQALTAIDSLSTADLKSIVNIALMVSIDAVQAGIPGGAMRMPRTGNLESLITTIRTLVGSGDDITG